MQPFHKVLAASIGENIGNLLGYPNGDFGCVARRMESGADIYYSIDGQRLFLDSSKTWQAFHVLRGMTPNTTDTRFSCTGFDLDSQMTFVLFGFSNEFDQDRAWLSISAFDSEKIIYNGQHATGRFSGYASFTAVNDDAVTIANKYNLQTSNIELVQAEIIALEIDYTLTLKGAKQSGEVLSFVVSSGSAPQGSSVDCCPQNNLTATRAPLATDDHSKGYSRGSTWIYNNTVYTLVDATTGAANWQTSSFVAGNYYLKTETYSQAETNTLVNAKVASVGAGTGVSITGTATAPVVNVTNPKIDADSNHIFGTGGTGLVSGQGTNNHFHGVNAGNGVTTGDDNIIVGNNSGTVGGSMDESVILGSSSNPNAAGLHRLFIVGKNITATEAGEIRIHDVIKILPTTQVTAIGKGAATSATSAAGGFFLGDDAGENCKADGWVCIGNNAGKGGSTGSTGKDLIFIGDDSGRRIDGTAKEIVAIGTGTVIDVRNSIEGVYIGVQAGEKIQDNGRNVMLGFESGKEADNDKVTFIGWKSGKESTANNSIFIGTESGRSETRSNTLHIDITDRTDSLIYGRFDDRAITINGRLRVTDNSVTAVAGDIRYNATTNKHQGYNGTSWNDMY